MHVRKYDMMMLVRHAKDGDGQTRHWRYQRRPCAVWGGLNDISQMILIQM